jgi:ribosomal protein S6--L-glutamate ligase
VKIAILSRDGTLYSCKRLRDAAAKRGHQVDILDPMSCYMNIDPAASSIHYKGRQLPRFDAVIPRIGSQITFYGTAALRQFEMLGSYPLMNPSPSHAPAINFAPCNCLPVRGSICP